MDQAPNVQIDNHGHAIQEHTETELLDILKRNEKLHPLDAFAKEVYGTKVQEAIEKDTALNFETHMGENAVRLGALSSIAALRAVGIMNLEKGE